MMEEEEKVESSKESLSPSGGGMNLVKQEGHQHQEASSWRNHLSLIRREESSSLASRDQQEAPHSHIHSYRLHMPP